MAAAGQETPQWRRLGTPSAELRLENSLPTGQSFRWRRLLDDEYIGVIGQRVVHMRQLESDVEYRVVARGAAAAPSADAEALADYFNLSHSLAGLAAGWAAADARFAAVHPYIPGARLLRQDPLECLFSFVCSSNNHISRIHGMVERLCRAYGTPLLAGGVPAEAASLAAGVPQAAAEGGATSAAAADGMALYAFPTLEQLSAATEEALREDGFGYRAKYITGSVAQLLARPEGGTAWLRGLRVAPYAEATEALCALPGIGPKVAACVCLFSLDKYEAIPVDTHVWKLACKYYAPHLRGKSLTKKVHDEVAAAFQKRFGAYAGWAHNTLFISELASMKGKLGGGAVGSSGESSTDGEAAGQPATPPEVGDGGRSKRRRVRRSSSTEATS